VIYYPLMKLSKFMPSLGTNQLRLFTLLAALTILALMPSMKVNKKALPHMLSTHTINLENRYSNSWVSNIFKDNILLNLAYLRGTIGKTVDWNQVEKPFTYSFRLQPGKTFAFHNDVLSNYLPTLVKTTNAHFNSNEGFKSDGYLVGDGVCHLASLIYWAARDARLPSYAPTNHDFAQIPGIPKEFGVAIYNAPSDSSANQNQNLYITNNFKTPIEFKFNYDGKNLSVSVLESTPSNLALVNTPSTKR